MNVHIARVRTAPVALAQDPSLVSFNACVSDLPFTVIATADNADLLVGDVVTIYGDLAAYNGSIALVADAVYLTGSALAAA